MMKLYRTKNFPTEMSVARDYLFRAKAASIGEHVVHVFNLEEDKMSFARNTLSLFQSVPWLTIIKHAASRPREFSSATQCGKLRRV